MENLSKLTYTVKEAVKITGLSRTVLWRAVRTGKLKRCSLGIKRVLFTREALEEFLGIKK